MISKGNDWENKDITYEELVVSAQKGEERATEIILDGFKPVVRAITRPFFLVGADSEDVLQEGMIALYRAICTYSPDKGLSFSQYASVCIKRQIISAVRKANSKKNDPLNNYIPFEDCCEDDLAVMDPALATISEESHKAFMEKLRAILSGLEFKILTLYVSGRSYKEIADKIGKDEKSVNNGIQRIRKKIKNSGIYLN